MRSARPMTPLMPSRRMRSPGRRVGNSSMRIKPTRLLMSMRFSKIARCTESPSTTKYCVRDPSAESISEATLTSTRKQSTTMPCTDFFQPACGATDDVIDPDSSGCDVAEFDVAEFDVAEFDVAEFGRVESACN